MKSWHEFITMGGYAAYVWSSYGIALVIMLANAILPGRQQRRILKELRSRMHRREQSE
ncbi:MAG TPA: heme exporter protein CcmD [Gammaproteobacteria bacterium]|nr:heme exporter protein CcmD [Gammaproteobacteria bacterium]